MRELGRLSAASACGVVLVLGACASSEGRDRSAPSSEATAVVFATPAAALDGAVGAARVEPGFLPQEGGRAGEVVSTAPRIGSENDPVGPYGQPEWTTRRRWARTRAYVLPEGQVEVEQWYRGSFNNREGPHHLGQTEVGFGLPYRMQFDLYANYDHADDTTKWRGVQGELRHALGDWGEIPLNPTLYAEYKWNHDAENAVEGKILLTEDLAPCLHWGMNLSAEQELGGERASELAVTQAIAWPLIDRKLSIGAEFEYARTTIKGERDDPENAFYAGPSLQWRPTENTHLDVVPLVGFDDAEDYRLFIIFGIDFGGAPEPSRGPIISRSR